MYVCRESTLNWWFCHSWIKINTTQHEWREKLGRNSDWRVVMRNYQIKKWNFRKYSVDFFKAFSKKRRYLANLLLYSFSWSRDFKENLTNLHNHRWWIKKKEKNIDFINIFFFFKANICLTTMEILFFFFGLFIARVLKYRVRPF